MFDHSTQDQIIDTRINYWPALVDGMATVLIIMFLLFLMKGFASGELEAARARNSLLKLQSEITRRFDAAELPDVVKCQYSPNLLRVTFRDGVLFESKQATLQPLGRRVLSISADALRAANSPFEQIQVEGHTDSVKMQQLSYPHDNWELSSARALEVLKELLKLGVHPKVISANGYADQVKVDLGNGENANRKNRRIELRIIYSMPKASASTANGGPAK